MLRFRSLSCLLLVFIAVLFAVPTLPATASTRSAGAGGRHHSGRQHHHHHRHQRKHHQHRRVHHRHAAKVRAVHLPPQPQDPVPFQVASFNALGASHTDGAHPERAGWRGSKKRIRDTGALFESYGLDIVGLQEFQPRQQAAFRAAYGSTFDFVVGDGPGRPNAVAWRRSRFTLVSTSMLKVPYFHGEPTPMPVVTLLDRRTGRQLTVLSVHNPADTHGPAQRWRDAATAKELRALTALRTSHPGVPVLWLGDMNDRATFFCAATAGAVFHAAAGGSDDALGCVSPDYDGIDWVLGSSNLAFSGWTVDHSTQDSGISDHPLVVSTAVIGTQAPVPALPDPTPPTVPLSAGSGPYGADD